MIDLKDYTDVVSTENTGYHTGLSEDHELIGWGILSDVDGSSEVWLYGVPKKYDYIEIIPNFNGRPPINEYIDEGWQVVAYSYDPEARATIYTMRRERTQENVDVQ